MDMEKLITRKEAAKLLGISLATLDEARNSGLISYIQYVPKRKQPTEMCEETNRTFEQIVWFW